jgi:hypothetical protein
MNPKAPKMAKGNGCASSPPGIVVQFTYKDWKPNEGPSLPIRDYLGPVLPGLADSPINQIAELTPNAWAFRNQLSKLLTPEPAELH